jgi:anthraniloyl-CoA monooxygenase
LPWQLPWQLPLATACIRRRAAADRRLDVAASLFVRCGRDHTERALKVVVVGGGPAGLYFALLMKKADPRHDVVVLERNAPDDTFGWGVVFSDQTLKHFRRADEPTYTAITDHFAHWDDIDVHVKGRTITSSGHGFSGIARKTLLTILRERATALDVSTRFRTEIASDADLPALGLGDYDLLVAADGVNSVIRRQYAESFCPAIDVRSAKYIWLGTTRRFDAFTFAFVETPGGAYQAHAYRFDEQQSAFIVECDEASWRAAGFDRMDTAETVAACERMFAPWLDGHPLLTNMRHLRGSQWLSFPRVTNARWYLRRATNDARRATVLIGDAAHTAHFSIGSGTKLAMEDAISLAKWLNAEPSNLERALESYQAERQTEALRLQNAARNSMEWFENVRRYLRLEPEQFAYSLLTRSQRVSHENLRLRDRRYLEGVERWFAARASSDTTPAPEQRTAGAPGEPPAAVPPMFTPFTLRGMTVVNRVVVSPMDMYSARDGVPNDFHLVHLGARALGGAGLVVTEMTCVSPEGRITLGCTGLYTAEQAEAWRRIVDFVHDWSPAKICLQLGHSGRKGSTKLGLEGTDIPMEDGNWEVVAPSPLAHRPTMQVPREMTRADMESVRTSFVHSTELAIDCGFDMVELHCAHGYLLSSFITPLANRRTDEYGGTPENRLRFPLEVFSAMRAAWPAERPMSVRISATDWVEGGVTGADAVAIARAFTAAGADIIHVSTGQTSPDAKPVYGRMWQTPFSDRIRNEAGLRTIAVGNITEPDQVNSIIAAGRADLCALARPHLADANWTQRAAAELGYTTQWWPAPYKSGKEQLERLRGVAPRR